jgi:hypothetical protein
MPLEPFHLYVGQNQKYKTITDAVNEWKNISTINKQPTIVHIAKGVYKESIRLDGTSNISFIGEGKQFVTWKSTTGYYSDAPLIIGGNVLIKGITFLADHSDNPSYTYTPYSNGSGGASYGLHVDDGTAQGTVTIEECDLISYQNAGLGSGTRINQSIKIRDTNIYSYSTYPETQTNGGMLYHTASETLQTNQTISLRNVRLYSQNDVPLAIYVNNTDVSPTFEAINVNLSSGTITSNASLLSLHPSTNTLVFTKNNSGNNVEQLNNPSSSWQKAILTDPAGICQLVTDFNNVRFGYFMGNGGAGCLNTPTAAWYTGFAVTYSATGYTVQYAWDITNGTTPFKMYKRYYTNATNGWSAWTPVVEAQSDVTLPYSSLDSSGNAGLITDFNSATKSGKYYCNPNALNAPGTDAYFIDVISANNSYKMQYAWKMSDITKKFKRQSISGTWQAWITCTE